MSRSARRVIEEQAPSLRRALEKLGQSRKEILSGGDIRELINAQREAREKIDIAREEINAGARPRKEKFRL